MYQQHLGRGGLGRFGRAKALPHPLQQQLQVARCLLPGHRTTTLDQRQTTLHRVLQTEQQQRHGDHRQNRTGTDGTDEQQARQLLVTRHPTEQPEQIIHDLYLPVATGA
ncbi:hypothetical protein D3C84_779110 [compost metagenome]